MLAVASAVSVGGCANFASQAAPESWTPAATLSPEAAPHPTVPGQGGPSGGQGPTQNNPTSVPPPQGCQDFNPAVIATCLDTVSAVAVLPGSATDPVGLAAERRSGRILRVHKGSDATVLATLAVDPAGDGGLTGLALSPTYAQDRLIFAYVSTPTDNRVVLLAPGDTPKPVLTGIPHGTTDNRGVLTLDPTGALLVATGDAGNPALAADPKSLAGKVLRIDVTGKPAPGNPNPSSMVISSGLVDPGGLCTSVDGGRTWVTDRTSDNDLLYRVMPGQPLGDPAWTWPDRPGVAGCASFPTSVMVAMSVAANAQALTLNADGTFTGTPQVALTGNQGFGRLAGVDIMGESSALVGTVNKDGGSPVSSDDRVVVISGSNATGGGQD